MPRHIPAPWPIPAIACSLIFLALVAALAAVGRVPWLLIGWYVAISAITYRIYRVDKLNSIAKNWRISNVQLHTLDLLGAWPGAWIGQKRWRNKTEESRFTFMRVVSIVVHLYLLFALGFGDHGSPMHF